MLQVGVVSTGKDAIREVRRLRCPRAVESMSQEAFVHQYAVAVMMMGQGNKNTGWVEAKRPTCRKDRKIKHGAGVQEELEGKSEKAANRKLEMLQHTAEATGRAKLNRTKEKGECKYAVRLGKMAEVNVEQLEEKMTKKALKKKEHLQRESAIDILHKKKQQEERKNKGEEKIERKQESAGRGRYRGHNREDWCSRQSVERPERVDMVHSGDGNVSLKATTLGVKPLDGRNELRVEEEGLLKVDTEGGKSLKVQKESGKVCCHAKQETTGRGRVGRRDSKKSMFWSP